MVRKRFCHSQSPGAQKLCQFGRRYHITHHVRYAVASKKILIPLSREWYCLIKGRGGGGEVMVESAPPRQSVVCLFFVVVSAKVFSDFFWIFTVSKILPGNSPAGPPNSSSMYLLTVTFYYDQSMIINSCGLQRICFLFCLWQIHSPWSVPPFFDTDRNLYIPS